MLAVAVAGGARQVERARDPLAPARDRALHLVEAVRAAVRGGAAGQGPVLAAARRDADDAAAGTAPVEEGDGTPQDVDPVHLRPLDVVEVGGEAGRVVERDPVEEDLDPPDAALGQDPLAAHGEVHALAVRLVVDLDSRHGEQRLVGADAAGDERE